MGYYKSKEEWKEYVEEEIGAKPSDIKDIYPTKKEQLEAYKRWDREEKIKSFAELAQKNPGLSQRKLYRKAKAGGFSIRQVNMAKVVKEERSVGIYWAYEIHTTIKKITRVKKRGRIVSKVTTKKDIRYITDGVRRTKEQIRTYLQKIIYIYTWDLVSIDYIVEKHKPYVNFAKRIEELMEA